MTIADDLGRKATKQTKQTQQLSGFMAHFISMIQISLERVSKQIGYIKKFSMQIEPQNIYIYYLLKIEHMKSVTVTLPCLQDLDSLLNYHWLQIWELHSTKLC